jgi:hypothetical protein
MTKRPVFFFGLLFGLLTLLFHPQSSGARPQHLSQGQQDGLLVGSDDDRRRQQMEDDRRRQQKEQDDRRRQQMEDDRRRDEMRR